MWFFISKATVSTTDAVQSVYYPPDAVHKVSTRFNAYCIYQMQCSLYLPDSAHIVSTHVDVWRDDRAHPISQRGDKNN